MGHIRDLERKLDAIMPEKDFQFKWKLVKSAEQQINTMSKYISKCNKLILATDMDREGEGIAWHIVEHLKVNFS